MTQMTRELTRETNPRLAIFCANTSRWHRALNGWCEELHISVTSCVLNAGERCHAALLPVYLPGIPSQAVPSLSPRDNDRVRPTKR